jgi:hypothetical protein
MQAQVAQAPVVVAGRRSQHHLAVWQMMQGQVLFPFRPAFPNFLSQDISLQMCQTLPV